MTALAWPTGVPQKALVDGWSWDPYGDPLASEMERGNKRLRQYAGINIATCTFNLLMTKAQYATFLAWLNDDCARGTARFTMDVYDGSAYVNKTCQFSGKPKIGQAEPYRTVGLTLTVYNV